MTERTKNEINSKKIARIIEKSKVVVKEKVIFLQTQIQQNTACVIIKVKMEKDKYLNLFSKITTRERHTNLVK